jgi:hypothetical protein
MTKKVNAIGLIVEDDSDFDSLKKIISRIAEKNNITFKKLIGKGCGRLKRKADCYATNLYKKGCNMIILVHDLDRNNYGVLHKDLSDLIVDSPANFNFVCIPKEEIEGWFLSDPTGIKNTLGLKRIPNIRGIPENIPSPKEKLRDYVYLCSDKTMVYLNTAHNSKLADKISIAEMKRKCQSFRTLYDFIKEHKY